MSQASLRCWPPFLPRGMGRLTPSCTSLDCRSSDAFVVEVGDLQNSMGGWELRRPNSCLAVSHEICSQEPFDTLFEGLL